MDPSAPNQANPQQPSITPAGVPQQAQMPQQAPGQVTAPTTQDPAQYAPGPQQAPLVPEQTVSPGGPAPVRMGAEKKKGKPEEHPNSTQNMLQIAEVRDGIVIMNDGSFRSVIMVKSINFDLMSPQEQEAIEYSYQGFLNSLYFPIQIYMRSQKVDLQPYIEKLDKIRTEHDNMLLALLMEDYIGYIGALSEQTNIMDKNFYVVIPYFSEVSAQKALDQSKNFLTGVGRLFKPKEQHVVINEADLENAKSELRNRVQAVLAGLMQCGVQGIPLDTQELIELYYDTYNPDTATRQRIRNIDDLTVDMVTKGQGKAPQAHLQQELQ